MKPAKSLGTTDPQHFLPHPLSLQTCRGPRGPEGPWARRQTFFRREVEELIHLMRLQLNLRDDCLARGINLEEESNTVFKNQ